MAEDVIDIRKRIEEMRNEVSSALAEGEEVVIPSAPAGEVAEFSVPGVTATATARKAEEPAPDRVAMQQTKGALDDALQLLSPIVCMLELFAHRQCFIGRRLLMNARLNLKLLDLKVRVRDGGER